MYAESTECFVEDQAFPPSYDLAPPPTLSPLSGHQVVSLSQSFCVSPFELTDGRGGEGVQGEDPNARQRESLVFYKLVNILFYRHCLMAEKEQKKGRRKDYKTYVKGFRKKVPIYKSNIATKI